MCPHNYYSNSVIVTIFCNDVRGRFEYVNDPILVFLNFFVQEVNREAIAAGSSEVPTRWILVFGPKRPPTSSHYWVLLVINSGFLHCSPLRFDLAAHLRHAIFDAVVASTEVTIAITFFGSCYPKGVWQPGLNKLGTEAGRTVDGLVPRLIHLADFWPPPRIVMRLVLSVDPPF